MLSSKRFMSDLSSQTKIETLQYQENSPIAEAIKVLVLQQGIPWGWRCRQMLGCGAGLWRWSTGWGYCVCVVMPWTWSCVVVSNRRVCFMSTRSPKLRRKSALKIGFCTLAITKIHLRLRVRDRVPNVVIDDPLTAWRVSFEILVAMAFRTRGWDNTHFSTSVYKKTCTWGIVLDKGNLKDGQVH